MRGTKSIMQSSNALYVVDGMPMRSGRSTGDTGAFGSAGATEPIADLNPDDIESLSVLTGAAAAALYGSEAANGAIVIHHKRVRPVRQKSQSAPTPNGTRPGFCPASRTPTVPDRMVHTIPTHHGAGVRE